jgi:hypothetical protein
MAGRVLAAEPAAEAPAAYSWQEPHAKVLPNGGLEWAPKPFVFEKSGSVRYIDFAAGDDAKDGKTPQAAWRRHPWDANAAGEAKAAKGAQTYVFKSGVVYRGTLQAAESGTPDHPIRLTRDPAWGEGVAAFYGSIQIKGGWKKATADDAPGIPHPEKVWYVDLGRVLDPVPDEAKASAMWQVDADKVERLHIARYPNYDRSDPNDPVKNWLLWSAYDKNTGMLTSPALKDLGDKNLLDGAIIWSEADFLMGSAKKMRAQWNYDPAAGTVVSSLLANSRWYNRIPKSNVHFMIENVRQFLDAPGEYFFEPGGPRAGRLYLLPPGGIDPNTVVYEVAKVRSPLVISDQHDIIISGLEFRYNNPDEGTPPDFSISQAQAPARYSTAGEWTMPCISIVGRCANITVKNCNFYDVADAIVACPQSFDDQTGSSAGALDNIIISDNDIQHAELSGAISIIGESARAPDAAFCRLGHLEVLRNRIIDSGFRHGYSPWSSIPAICVSYPETCEIAGNIVDTSFGNGIVTCGGKSTGAFNTVPLTRILVHHNQLDNTMLGCNDYGGLEHFQGGPVYIFDNIIRNCVGNRTKDDEKGYSLYLDGGFKCYCFNNIMAGNVKADRPDYYNNCGYFMVFGFMDQLFDNTIYHFNNALDGSSGNRSNILGNLMVDCKLSFIGQNRPGDVSMLGGGDTGAMGRIGIPTMSYSSNVFWGSPNRFGEVAGTSTTGTGQGEAPVVFGKTLGELRAKLESEKCRLADVGWQVAEPPLAAPAQKDYRPTPASGARERGVKYFVPWALARTVGEWNFYANKSSPQVVLGEGFYMTEEYADRGMYYFIPRNDLTVSACSASDYIAGPLEDWIDGALVFDGKSRVATLTHAEMTRTVRYRRGGAGEAAGAGRAPGAGAAGPATGPGAARGAGGAGAPGGFAARPSFDGSKRESLDMATNNFLIEIVFRTDPGQKNGVLASKSTDSGYTLAVGPEGAPCVTLQTPGATMSATATAKVNDGQWHHVLAEVDRAGGKTTFYVDGKPAGETSLAAFPKDAPLSNTADFIVGKGFAGAIDFLRVCRSTLVESKTTIQELYTWEFDGPAGRDFRGKKPDGKRTAGAIEWSGKP